MAYTGSPGTDNTDAVRLLIWDISTSTSGEIFSDTEVDWFIAVSPNIYSAACLALNTMAARVSTLSSSTSSIEEKKVGDLSLRFGVSAGNAQGLVGAISALCAKLSKQSALQVGPYAGGITRSDKQVDEANTDRVRPAFTRNQFQNPAVVDPPQSSTSTT